MWLILLLSICLASFKNAVAEDLRYGQDVIRRLKNAPLQNAPLSYSPSFPNYPSWNFGEKKLQEDLRHGQDVIRRLKYAPLQSAPLSYSPSLPNYLSWNFGEKKLQVPMMYNKIHRHLEESQTSPNNCPQVENLQNILGLLRRFLSEDDNPYLLQPDKRLQILQSLKEYLEEQGSHDSKIHNHLKLKEIVDSTDKPLLIENDASHHNHNGNHKDHIHANFIFKYDIPSVHNLGCKEALALLIRTVENAYLLMRNYCNQSGKCLFNSDLGPSNIQNGPSNIFTLDPSTSIKPIITPTNQHSLNIYDVQNSINNLLKMKNQGQTQKGFNDYFNPHILPQTDLHDNQFLTTNYLNPGSIQTLNQEKNIDAYNNVYLNKAISQSNTQYRDKSNILNSILNYRHTIPAQAQIMHANRYPVKTYDVNNFLNNLVSSPNQKDVTQTGSNSYLKFHLKPDVFLNSNQIVNALNAGVGQTETILNQEENLDTSKNKYLNIFNKKFNTATITTNPLLQSHRVERYIPMMHKNEPNQQLLYKLSQILNDKSGSMATINQNKHNIKEQVQYEGGLIPRHHHNNLNQLQNYNKLQNQLFGHIVSPTDYIKQNPYLSSIYKNIQNKFNFNSQEANAASNSNLGYKFYTPKNLVNYPKHNVYGDTLNDFHRFASVPNSVKLKSVSDNEGVVELTYKLKRPPTANPYYYVKFRMPYKDFVSKIADLSKNPHMRSDPIKLHQELLSVSNLAEASPDLNNVQPEEVSNLILNNGGTLIGAQILGINDSNVDQYLTNIQNLNSKLNTNEILNLFKVDKMYNLHTPLIKDMPFAPQQNPYETKLSHKHEDAQVAGHVEPRRLYHPMAQYNTRGLPITFLPAKVPFKILSNPILQHTAYATFN